MTLKELREKNELTQAAFAKALGVSSSLIRSIETGTKKVTDTVADKVLEVFDVVIETTDKVEGKVGDARSAIEKKKAQVRETAEKMKKQVEAKANDAAVMVEETFGAPDKPVEATVPAAKATSMSKTELIGKVAEENKMTKKAAAAAVDSIFNTIMDTVAARDTVTLPGFGTFSCKHRDARQGRNPATGEAMEIAASDTPVFKAAKAFKEKVN